MKTRSVACSRCNGTGKIMAYLPHQSQPEERTCDQCNGTTIMDIVVPDEIASGMRQYVCVCETSEEVAQHYGRPRATFQDIVSPSGGLTTLVLDGFPLLMNGFNPGKLLVEKGKKYRLTIEEVS